VEIGLGPDNIAKVPQLITEMWDVGIKFYSFSFDGWCAVAVKSSFSCGKAAMSA
jgi:hypothetical protein